MKTKILLIAAAAILMFSCGNKHNRQADLDNITKYEDSIDLQHSILSVETGTHLMDLYTNFASSYPEDSLAPVFWHRAAQVAANIHRPDLALQYLDTVTTKYTDYKDVAVCAFYKGFVLENVAGDIEHARAAYQDFIDQYPNDPLVKDAQISIENLGLSPEELLEKILSQNPDAQNEIAEKQ
ncbi:MAG: tetratricopeptide repeat protein [Bacteroidales bacterium]|nr:tetratricopeptide repeat protein [Bacteroidales bacterium]